MRGIRRSVILIVLTVVVLALTSGTSSAGTTTGGGRYNSLAARVIACGQVINASILVSNDLANCPATGLIIDADNIVLDLAGHVVAGDGINGDGVWDPGILLSGHHGVTVRNGTVRQFDTAVSLDGA